MVAREPGNDRWDRTVYCAWCGMATPLWGTCIVCGSPMRGAEARRRNEQERLVREIEVEASRLARAAIEADERRREFLATARLVPASI